MSADTVLTNNVHADILRREILPESGIGATTAHQHPRAIILAGQPGAGKGGLVAAQN